ncbi:MAG: hypothetical protein ACI4R9_02205 [Kiritimatiellia bacterium]
MGGCLTIRVGGVGNGRFREDPSKKYRNFGDRLPEYGDPSVFTQLLKWDEVQSWPGCIVGTMDYDVMDRVPWNTALAAECRFWNEGYPNWWILSNIRRLPTPIPCRGNVGMWRLPEELPVDIERHFTQTESDETLHPLVLVQARNSGRSDREWECAYRRRQSG